VAANSKNAERVIGELAGWWDHPQDV